MLLKRYVKMVTIKNMQKQKVVNLKQSLIIRYFENKQCLIMKERNCIKNLLMLRKYLLNA